MKIYVLHFVLFILLAAGCREHKTHQHETISPKTGQKAAATLTLNEGRKWKLDEPTRENMKLIRQTFDETQTQMADYSALAADLQTKSNKLVSECRMSGKDHDMLHIWLTEYLSALKELTSSEAVTQESAYHKIETQLTAFDQYFE
ncbi:MAG TPA: hypothetical protein VJ765_06300 [Chitinophagaceae bacterium]|nr:hypothetical protein [Chitinophagaceae bacterium]